jgi:hypothetical protein
MVCRRVTWGAAVTACFALLLAACGFGGGLSPDGNTDDSADLDADVDADGDTMPPDSPQGSLAIDLPSADFGSVSVGAGAAKVFTVTNTGTVRTGILAANISGGGATAFSHTTTCTTLAPNASCTVTVTFRPSVAGNQSAALTVSGSPGGSAQALLIGAGSASNDLSITPMTIEFGNVLVGQDSTPQQIEVTAGGGGSLGPVMITVSDAEFETANDTCSGVTLGGLESCTFDVIAAPTSSGARTADVTVSASGTSPGTVALSVQAIISTDAALVATPAMGAFPITPLLTTSSAQTFTIQNAGGQPSGVLSVALTGDDFDLVSEDCDGEVLATNATCSVVIAFNPLAPGDRTGLLTVVGSPGTVTVGLAGHGAVPPDLSLSPDVRDYGSVLVFTQSAPATFTVTNPGSIPSGALAVSIVGANPTQFQIVDDQCQGRAVPPLTGTCTISVRYFPTVLGMHTATLVIQGAPGGTDTATLTGTAVPLADLVAFPSAALFGSVAVGTTSPPQTITVNYPGTMPTGALTVTSSSPRFVLSADMCTGTSLNGNSCTFAIAFAPNAAQAEMGTITVQASPGGTATIATSGTGTAMAILDSSADALSFGSVSIGSTTTQSVTISNTGNAASSPLAVDIMGTNADSFAITTDDCTGQPLAAGASCSVTIELAPLVVGPHTAALTITAMAGGSLSIPMDGQGIASARLVPNPTSSAFGNVSLGTTSGSRTVTVSNVGGATSAAVAVELSGSGASHFDVTADMCTGVMLAANESCTFAVRFAPNTAGAKTAVVSIMASGAVGSQVALSGTGVTPADLDITPAMYDFGPIGLGSSSVTHDFTVRNVGGSPSGTIATSLTGVAAGQYDITSDGCNGMTLAVGASCVVKVEFNPTSTGAKAASLRVAATPGGTVTSALTGTGVNPMGMSISPTDKAYGGVTVGGRSPDQTFVITNTGALTLNISSVMITGANPGQFEITMDNCTGATLILVVAPTCTFAGRFTPSSMGTKMASFVVRSSQGPSATATVSGRGI